MTQSKLNNSNQAMSQALTEEAELQKKYPGYRGVDEDYLHAGKQALERCWDWKFGIRIHWSLYSITGNGEESWPLTSAKGSSPVFRQQYEELYKWWNPSLFNADEWMELFLRAGLKFFVFTTKHHDGFSMYDTRTKVKKRLIHTGPDAGKIVDCDLHYSIMETPFKRDIVKELVEAGRRRSLGIGLYFSHIDWFDPDFRIDQWNYQRDTNYTRQSDPEGFRRMIARHREQVKELCSNYGRIDLLSFDMGFPGGIKGIDDCSLGLGTEHKIRDELVKTVKMARRLQPQMLLRRRGIDPYGDYKTPERVVPDSPEAVAEGQGMPWQVIYPGSRHFSHIWGDEYKPASWIIENLADITAKGGNFQVGYGPGPDGRWDPHIVQRLEEVGDWLKVNGEAIYATRPCKNFKEGKNIRFTRSKDHKFIYVIILNWPQLPFSNVWLKLKSVRARRGSSIRMLGLGHNFQYTQEERVLSIQIPEWLADPEKQPCKHAYVFRIEPED